MVLGKWLIQPMPKTRKIRIDKNYFTSCDPHHDIYRFVTGKSAGILSDIFSGISSGILSDISSGILSGILSGISSGILPGISSGISSGIPSGILSGILSGKSSGILSGKHSGTLSGISSGNLSDILSGILSGILLAFYLAYLLAFYLAYLLAFYLAVEVQRCALSWEGPRLRSGREHLAWILAVEVRQGTLGVDGRGWGPAGNTGRGYSRLRSGREHWAGMVVVEVRQGTLSVDRGWAGGGGEERRGEEQATDIKSNNLTWQVGNKYGKRLASASGIDLHVWWVLHIYGKLLEGKFPMNFSLRADAIGLPMACSSQDRPPAQRTPAFSRNCRIRLHRCAEATAPEILQRKERRLPLSHPVGAMKYWLSFS